jgi:hypothetical protein
VKALHVGAITNDIFPEVRKHYVTIFVLCRREDASQEPKVRNAGPWKHLSWRNPLIYRQVLEPDKCESWSWASWNDIRALARDTLFLPIAHLLEQYDDVEQLFA